MSDDLLSPTTETEGDGTGTVDSGAGTDAPIALPPAGPQEPHDFTEQEVGEYKETDRYLPVRPSPFCLLSIVFL